MRDLQGQRKGGVRGSGRSPRGWPPRFSFHRPVPGTAGGGCPAATLPGAVHLIITGRGVGGESGPFPQPRGWVQGSMELLPHDHYMEMVVFFKAEGQLTPNYSSKNKITVLKVK